MIFLKILWKSWDSKQHQKLREPNLSIGSPRSWILISVVFLSNDQHSACYSQQFTSCLWAFSVVTLFSLLNRHKTSQLGGLCRPSVCRVNLSSLSRWAAVVVQSLLALSLSFLGRSKYWTVIPAVMEFKVGEQRGKNRGSAHWLKKFRSCKLPELSPHDQLTSVFSFHS